ncbi:cytochrome c biogenesis CcdA family protein [Sutcliffiella rhizosphaerae]|uniref:cytochrome c biogenesis CcdA family protein n=1 Tax=Sutcliffiella rhizosphaerae TaxID=2880967 RepID=UPI00295EA31C|nr:cytochrome c biogenesis CcdA family protein [Sutcliffiella rhizosphaerae]
MTVIFAFFAGLLAFISPCCLPLYPSFISYITGISVSDLKDNKRKNSFRKKVLLHSISFCLGLSLVYYILGFSLGSLGAFFSQHQRVLTMFGGIFLVAMGLFMMGIIKPSFMFKEWKFRHKKKSVSYMNSFFVGFIFSAGWTPCIGPIFGSIITYSSIVNPAETFMNVTAYSLGFSIPFVIMAFFIGKLKFILKYSSTLMKIGGFIILILGFMIYFDKMLYLNIWTAQIQYFIESLFE